MLKLVKVDCRAFVPSLVRPKPELCPQNPVRRESSWGVRGFVQLLLLIAPNDLLKDGMKHQWLWQRQNFCIYFGTLDPLSQPPQPIHLFHFGMWLARFKGLLIPPSLARMFPYSLPSGFACVQLEGGLPWWAGGWDSLAA